MVPNSTRVRLAQEDYWVYQALLTIIKKTNGDATTHSAAAVKTIGTIEIGKEAADTIKSSMGPMLVAAPEGTTTDATVPDRPEPAFSPQSTEGSAGESSADAALRDSRYVDDKMNPLPGNQPSPFAEFKMMPIVMRLVIDQRKIPNLLVECANSTMPVEVKQLWINPGAENAAKQVGSWTGVASSGTRVGTGSGGPADDEANPYEIPIEIHGIIYIYEPPDLKKLATGTEAGKTAENATDPTAPSAAAPATTGVPADARPAPRVPAPGPTSPHNVVATKQH